MEENWRQIRLKGMFRFVVLYGILRYGFLGGSVAFLYDLFFEVNYTIGSKWTIECTRSLIGSYIGFMITIAPLYGVFTWFSNEKKYKRKVEVDMVKRYT